MTESVKITRVFTSDKSKDGKPFITKTGKPFWKVGILTDKYPDAWLSALAFDKDDAEMNLNEGDEVKIVIETNGQYKNFKLPTRFDLLEERIVKLEEKVGHIVPYEVASPKKVEITEDDIPF